MILATTTYVNYTLFVAKQLLLKENLLKAEKYRKELDQFILY
jgi:hypothetical protein